MVDIKELKRQIKKQKEEIAREEAFKQIEKDKEKAILDEKLKKVRKAQEKKNLEKKLFTLKHRKALAVKKKIGRGFKETGRVVGKAGSKLREFAEEQAFLREADKINLREFRKKQKAKSSKRKLTRKTTTQRQPQGNGLIDFNSFVPQPISSNGGGFMDMSSFGFGSPKRRKRRAKK